MRILTIFSRNIGINDSGGSRTTIQLLNYLVDKGCECYTTFKILEGGSSQIKLIYNNEITVNSLNQIVRDNEIDILLVPEGYYYAKIAHLSCLLTKCKVVSALHNKPGYEKQRLYVLLLESIQLNSSLLKRIRAAFFLFCYPFFYYFYTRKEKMKFRDAYNYSDKMVLLSQSFFDEFMYNYKIVDSTKFEAIGNALSFEEYATYDDIRNKKKQILVVARCDERQKRITYVLKLWSVIQNLYPEWTLEIVGDGRSKDLYVKLCCKLSLSRVTFHGRQDPLKYYKDASIFVMTSAYEGWGMTITEAQQMGCVPIVMNTFSSLRELIDNDYNGIIVNDDLDDLTTKLKELINNKCNRERIAINAVNSSKRFAKEIVCEKYFDLFCNILNDENK